MILIICFYYSTVLIYYFKIIYLADGPRKGRLDLFPSTNVDIMLKL